jgi:hypothetical protein
VSQGLRHHAAMDYFEDVVRFELPHDSTSLYDRLRASHLVWIDFGAGAQYVAVALKPEAGDLAVVLRVVESWAAERFLPGIRFVLDGRDYVVHGRPAFAAQAA